MPADEISPSAQLPDRPEGPRPDPNSETAPPPHRRPGRLTGKVALISGGDSGIGRAVAFAFAREGADVAILYRGDHEAAQATMHFVAEAGGDTMAVTGDIGESKFCDDAVAEVAKRFGRIDILVNATVERHEQPDFELIADAQIERTFRTNVYGQIFLARAVLPHLPDGAAIVTTSSDIAFQGHPELVDAAASHGAVVGFTHALALALSTRGIRVNAVAPGSMCQADAVAPSYVFLASEDGACMTGQVLHPTAGTIVAD